MSQANPSAQHNYYFPFLHYGREIELLNYYSCIFIKIFVTQSHNSWFKNPPLLSSNLNYSLVKFRKWTYSPIEQGDGFRMQMCGHYWYDNPMWLILFIDISKNFMLRNSNHYLVVDLDNLQDSYMRLIYLAWSAIN